MAKRTAPIQKLPANLNVPQMVRGIDRINRRINELENFDPESVQEQYSPVVGALESAIDETLEQVFGPGTTDFDRYQSAKTLSRHTIFFGGDPTPLSEIRSDLRASRDSAIATLAQAVKALEERIEDSRAPMALLASPLETKSLSTEIFVVHGHDGEAKEMVLRFLEAVGLRGIVLHEQANSGATLIEKFELHGSKAGFAVILLTDDDVGGKSKDDLKPRARQNVVFEFGYFVGRFGRNRVCAFKKGNTEFPSDLNGFAWHPLDGGWRQALAKELDSAGYEIDWNKVMRT